MSHVSPYPDYSRTERFADVMVHCIGVAAALCGVVFFVVYYAHSIGWGVLISTSVYAAGLLLMLIASAAYHMGAHTSLRAYLRRIDHAAIFVKIAATVTPLAIILGTGFSYGVLGLVWIFAGYGAATKLSVKHGMMTTPCWPYLTLGWLGILLLFPLYQILPITSITLILTGGLIYSGAVIFFWWDSLPYANAIWHGLVVLASACFFCGIMIAIASL